MKRMAMLATAFLISAAASSPAWSNTLEEGMKLAQGARCDSSRTVMLGRVFALEDEIAALEAKTQTGDRVATTRLADLRRAFGASMKDYSDDRLRQMGRDYESAQYMSPDMLGVYQALYEGYRKEFQSLTLALGKTLVEVDVSAATATRKREMLAAVNAKLVELNRRCLAGS